ncbi:MAG: hypothetical protein V3V20_10010 [Algisphaera sp.]
MTRSSSPPSPQAPDTSSSDVPEGGRTRMAKKGIWALLDQMLFAGANFLVVIGLAKWLDERAFGAFTTAYACFLLIGVFVTALIIEPLMVFGSGKYFDRRPHYLGKTLGIHLVITVAGGIVLMGVAAMCHVQGESKLATAMFCLALIQPMQLLPWTLRNATYLDSNPKPAAIAGFIYLAVVLGSLIGLNAANQLTVVSAILTMGMASTAACAYLIRVLGVDLRAALQLHGYGEILRDHWRYGRWAVPTNLTRYVPEQLPYLALPLLLAHQNGGVADLASGGALKAVMNFAMPLTLFAWALSTLALPQLVRARHTASFRTITFKMGLAVVGVPLLCLPLLGLLGVWLVGTAYSGKYVEYGHLLWLVGLIPVTAGIDAMLHSQLKAAERPDRLFWASVASSVVLLVAFAPLVWWGGVKGALIAIICGYLAQIVTLLACGGRIIQAQSLPANHDTQPILSTTDTVPLAAP